MTVDDNVSNVASSRQFLLAFRRRNHMWPSFDSKRRCVVRAVAMIAVLSAGLDLAEGGIPGKYNLLGRRPVLPTGRVKGASSGATLVRPTAWVPVRPASLYTGVSQAAAGLGLYPKFRCDDGPLPVLKYPSSPQGSAPCAEFPLPPRAERLTRTEARPQRPDVNATHPAYLFVIGTPYGGTTALLGLLSTSPNVAVPRAGWAHEGHWALVRTLPSPPPFHRIPQLPLRCTQYLCAPHRST